MDPKLPNQHAVQFYTDDAELLKTVGKFLSDGLRAGQPAIVIVTPEHRAGVEHELEAQAIDVAAAKRLGDLVMLDAEETLATFMVDQAPVGALFRRTIGDVIDQTLRGRERTTVRAYGEMVNVLWQQGRTDAAIRLEVLWNNLAETHAFSLLCSYAVGNFFKQTDGYQAVCDLHTHVHGPAPEEKVRPFVRRAIAAGSV